MLIKLEANHFKMEVISVVYVYGELPEKTAVNASYVTFVACGQENDPSDMSQSSLCKLATPHYQNVKAKYLKQWIDFYTLSNLGTTGQWSDFIILVQAYINSLKSMSQSMIAAARCNNSI